MLKYQRVYYVARLWHDRMQTCAWRSPIHSQAIKVFSGHIVGKAPLYKQIVVQLSKVCMKNMFTQCNHISYIVLLLLLCWLQSQMLHVWKNHLHLPQKWPGFVCKCSIHGASGNAIQTAIFFGGQVHSRSLTTQFHVYPLRVRGAAEGLIREIEVDGNFSWHSWDYVYSGLEYEYGIIECIWLDYAMVIQQIAIEAMAIEMTWVSHEQWWFSIVMWLFARR